VLGRNLRELSDREIAHWRNEHVGFIFQQFNLIPVLTALENVELPLKLTNLKKAERLEHAATALKWWGWATACTTTAAALGRAGTARGHRPRHRHRSALILADEPTGNLDAASAQEVLTILSKLNQITERPS